MEADKILIPQIKKVRPGNKVLNVGVAVSDQKEAVFYFINASGINTFDKKEAGKRTASGIYKIIEVSKVPLVNINTLISENFRIPRVCYHWIMKVWVWMFYNQWIFKNIRYL